MSDALRSVNCPRCGAQVPWVPASKHRPFCSERCRLVDLGAWATEQYRVGAVEEDRDAGGQSERPSGQ
ncbi:MAG TPA: DNA gyrase inhibitor YacG [Burkholderiales bacterium]|nr:DNA gyrase inhibitor YacG [Burkholderiales bacterium]